MRPGTDVYLDAAGAPAVPETVARIAKKGATLGIVAVHEHPVQPDLGAMLSTELTIVFAIISDRLPFDHALEALTLARTPGAADKIVVTFE